MLKAQSSCTKTRGCETFPFEAKTVKIYNLIWHMKRYRGKIYRVILVQGPRRWADRVVL